jgi:enolase
MNSIEAVSVTKILDAHGEDAVEAEVVTTSGYGRCSFPAPSETIRRAREEITTLIGKDANQQAEIDELLQDVFTLPNMSMVFSVAAANAAAASLEMPLYRYLGGPFANAMPYPLLNVFSAASDYFVVPTGASSFSAGIAASISIHQEFSKLNLSSKSNDVDVLDRLNSIIGEVHNRFGFEIKLGIDLTPSHYTSSDRNSFRPRGIDGTNRFKYVSDLIERYDLYYVEDSFDRTEFEYQEQLNDAFKTRCLIASNAYGHGPAVDTRHLRTNKKASILLLNPTTTIFSVFRKHALAKASSCGCAMLTHNSTTCETSPSHLAVALSTPFVKLSASGSENASKINELLRIEQELFEGSSCRMVKKPI